MSKAFNPVLQVKQVQYFDERYYRLTLYDDSLVWLPSVTTILQASPKPYLAKWRGQIGNAEADRIMRNSMDKGSRVHHACYIYAQGGGVIFDPPSFKELADLNKTADDLKRQFRVAGKPYVTLEDQEEMLMVRRYAEWFRVMAPKPIALEMIVYSINVGTAGMLDAAHQIEAGKYAVAGSKPLVVEQSGLYIQDLKTGNEDNDYWMQLAVYATMYALSTGTKVQGAMITYLDANVSSGIDGCKTVLKTWDELQEDYEAFLNVKRIWQRKFGKQQPAVFDFPNVLYSASLDEMGIPRGFTVPNATEQVAKDILPQTTVTDMPQKPTDPQVDTPATEGKTLAQVFTEEENKSKERPHIDMEQRERVIAEKKGRAKKGNNELPLI
jgi:hypothetical protein